MLLLQYSKIRNIFVIILLNKGGLPYPYVLKTNAPFSSSISMF